MTTRAEVEERTREFFANVPANRLNAYRCPRGRVVFSVELDRGVTPFTITCPECGGFMHSAFGAFKGMPDHLRLVALDRANWIEWYRPESDEGMSPASAEHFANGGLWHRPLRASEPPELPQ